MAKESTEGISFGAGLAICIGIVTFGLIVYNVVSPMLNTSVKKASSISQRITDSSYTQYDDADKQGSEVIGAINSQASADLYVLVKTNSNNSGKKYSTTAYNITDKNDINYVEPTAPFHATIIKNDNDTVVGITFIQQ